MSIILNMFDPLWSGIKQRVGTVYTTYLNSSTVGDFKTPKLTNLSSMTPRNIIRYFLIIVRRLGWAHSSCLRRMKFHPVVLKLSSARKIHQTCWANKAFKRGSSSYVHSIQNSPKYPLNRVHIDAITHTRVCERWHGRWVDMLSRVNKY